MSDDTKKNEVSFRLFEGHHVEIIEYQGQILYNPYHCGSCLALGDSAVRKAIGIMNTLQVIKLTNSDVKDLPIRKLNNAGENFLTKAGVNRLGMQSKKPEARRFQDWATDDVLVSIEDTGSYTLPNAPVTSAMIEAVMATPEFSYRLFGQVMEQKAEIEALEGEVLQKNELLQTKQLQIEEQKPLVDFAKIVSTDKALIEIGVFARRISTKGSIIGRNTLFAFMRKEGILFKVKGNDNLPKQKYIDAGYFVSKPVVGLNYHGKVKDKTFITARGQYWFVGKYYKKLFTGRYNDSVEEIREKQLSLLDTIAEGFKGKNE